MTVPIIFKGFKPKLLTLASEHQSERKEAEICFMYNISQLHKKRNYQIMLSSVIPTTVTQLISLTLLNLELYNHLKKGQCYISLYFLTYYTDHLFQMTSHI